MGHDLSSGLLFLLMSCHRLSHHASILILFIPPFLAVLEIVLFDLVLGRKIGLSKGDLVLLLSCGCFFAESLIFLD